MNPFSPNNNLNYLNQYLNNVVGSDNDRWEVAAKHTWEKGMFGDNQLKTDRKIYALGKVKLFDTKGYNLDQHLEVILRKFEDDFRSFKWVNISGSTNEDLESCHKKLDTLRKQVETKVTRYHDRHSGFTGKIYTFFRSLVYGDIDELSKKVQSEIVSLEVKIKTRIRLAEDADTDYNNYTYYKAESSQNVRQQKITEPFTDALTLFGLGENYTSEELSRVYRQKSRAVHPDKVGGNEEPMKQLSAAYTLLKDYKNF